jgi:hypothetical protein
MIKAPHKESAESLFPLRGSLFGVHCQRVSEFALLSLIAPTPGHPAPRAAKAEKSSPKEETRFRLAEAIIGLSQSPRRGFAHENPSCCCSVPVFKRVFSGFNETPTQHGNETSGL